VGRAWGPGSDSPEALALQVDLEAPSLLTSAVTGGKLVVANAPVDAQDAAIFAALAEAPSSSLLVAPLQVSGRTVGFLVADAGDKPVGERALEELHRVIAQAAETYGRLHQQER
jgi:transcriptional regulator with GAF, ATPase, and Fis domain